MGVIIEEWLRGMRRRGDQSIEGGDSLREKREIFFLRRKRKQNILVKVIIFEMKEEFKKFLLGRCVFFRNQEMMLFLNMIGLEVNKRLKEEKRSVVFENLGGLKIERGSKNQGDEKRSSIYLRRIFRK